LFQFAGKGGKQEQEQATWASRKKHERTEVGRNSDACIVGQSAKHTVYRIVLNQRTNYRRRSERFLNIGCLQEKPEKDWLVIPTKWGEGGRPEQIDNDSQTKRDDHHKEERPNYELPRGATGTKQTKV
jgi:hypothetical protein